MELETASLHLNKQLKSFYVMQPPLILTLMIDAKAVEYFNALRQQHFPPAINYIDAHLTLFHALPNEAAIIHAVEAAARSHDSFILTVAGPVSIGRGVAFKIENTKLAQLHKHFQQAWQQILTPQDKQNLWPHITVQNKVTAPVANTLLVGLKTNFTPFTVVAAGLQLWEYLNGPWKLLSSFYFKEINTCVSLQN